MEYFGDVFISFLTALVNLDFFQYLIISMAFFGVVFLIKKIIFD